MKNPVFNTFMMTLYSMILLAVQLTSASAESITGPAPDFTLKNTAGQAVQLKSLQGEVVMLNFWASWCGPCRQEMPLLDELYHQYKALGFTILGINVEEDPAKARELLQQVPVNFPVLFDSTNTITERYRIVAMPSTILIDRSGNMRFLHLGYQPGYELEYQDQIRQLIRE